MQDVGRRTAVLFCRLRGGSRVGPSGGQLQTPELQHTRRRAEARAIDVRLKQHAGCREAVRDCSAVEKAASHQNQTAEEQPGQTKPVQSSRAVWFLDATLLLLPIEWTLINLKTRSSALTGGE